MLVGIFIAMCVTFIGRKHIGEANKILCDGLPALSTSEESKYKNVLLGDTVFPEEEFLRRKEKLKELKREIKGITLFKLPEYYKDLTDRQRDVVKCVEYLEITLRGFKYLGSKIVYNDTDSSMVNFDIDLTYDLQKLGRLMQELISGKKEETLKSGLVIDEIPAVFKEPLKMEFEDFSQMVPIKPKYYLKAIREMDPEKIKKFGEFQLKKGKIIIKKKGVLTAKRGNSIFSMKVYQDLSDKVLFMVPCYESLLNLVNHVLELMSGKYTARDLVKITELGSDYKLESYYMNVFSKNLKKWGKPVRPGDRIEYVIVKTEEEIRDKTTAKVGDKCREIEMWEEDENREQLDYQYYVEKGLQKQYDDLYYVGYKKVLECQEMEKCGYTPQFSRCHFVHIRNPIKVIAAIVKDLMKPERNEFKEFILDNLDIKVKKGDTRYKYIGLYIEKRFKKIAKRMKRLFDENGEFIGTEKEETDNEDK